MDRQKLQRFFTQTAYGRATLRLILPLFLVIVLFACWLLVYGYSSPQPAAEKTVIIDIPKGSSLRNIQSLLEEQGVLEKDLRFSLLAFFTGYGRKLQAGEFEVKSGLTPMQLLRHLVSAQPVHYRITIPEGYSAQEIARLFGDGGWCDPRSFMNLVTDQQLIDKLGLQGAISLEGYLFPDTYLLRKGDRGAAKIVPMLVQRFHSVWQEITEGEEVDRNEVVTLASVIEKETGSGDERALISGVFHNRLRLGMKLQSDPTVVYGATDYKGAITKEHLRTDTPYNTYTRPGLPAGPISNPGKASLLAAMNPEETEALYFVSRNDGTHHFSSSLAEHNRAVQKYQRQPSSKQSK